MTTVGESWKFETESWWMILGHKSKCPPPPPKKNGNQDGSGIRSQATTRAVLIETSLTRPEETNERKVEYESRRNQVTIEFVLELKKQRASEITAALDTGTATGSEEGIKEDWKLDRFQGSIGRSKRHKSHPYQSSKADSQCQGNDGHSERCLESEKKGTKTARETHTHTPKKMENKKKSEPGNQDATEQD